MLRNEQDQNQIFYLASHQFRHSWLISLCPTCQSIPPNQSRSKHISTEPAIQEVITVNPSPGLILAFLPIARLCKYRAKKKKKFTVMAESFVSMYIQSGLKIIPKIWGLIYFCPTSFINLHLVYYFNLNTTISSWLGIFSKLLMNLIWPLQFITSSCFLLTERRMANHFWIL